jgi:tetratricopeptide (TPR) repeat protein
MDRLSEDLKKTMQVASVIGRDFAFRILKSIMELGEELRGRLSNLVGLEILYEKALFPELEYLFKHALTQEVAYESLLKQRRQEIHGRIAQAIEDLYAGRLEEHYELLAHHYERSGNAKKAVDYLILAGEKSNQHSAIQAAHEFFGKAIEMVVGKDIGLSAETEVRLHQGWAQANLGIGAIGKAVEGHKKTIGISRRHGVLDYEKRSLLSLASLMFAWHDRNEAEQILQEGISRAREIEDKALESQILSWASAEEFCYGSPFTGHQIGMEAEQIAMESGDPISILTARLLRGWPERWLGRPAKTIELTEGAAELARDTFYIGTLSKAIQNRAVALAEVGRIEDGIAVLEDIIGTSEKFGPFLPHASFFNSLGYCYSEIHQHKKAWRQNQKSENIASEFLEKYPMGRFQYAEMAAQARVNLMENLFDKGKIDDAWDRMESLKEESKSDDYDMVRYVWESRMNYLAAQILLQRNEIGQAEVLIGKNLERARTQGTKKREGGFLRLLGEVQIRRNESENAIENFNKAIVILKEVGNPRQLWQAHASLASAYDKIERSSEAKERWGVAAKVIRNTANGLFDRELRENFFQAEPIHEILSKAEN